LASPGAVITGSVIGLVGAAGWEGIEVILALAGLPISNAPPDTIFGVVLGGPRAPGPPTATSIGSLTARAPTPTAPESPSKPKFASARKNRGPEPRFS